jgi:hypothetical protein
MLLKKVPLWFNCMAETLFSKPFSSCVEVTVKCSSSPGNNGLASL